MGRKPSFKISEPNSEAARRGAPGLRTCPLNARCWRRPARKMHVPIWPDSAGRAGGRGDAVVRFSGGGAGVSPRGLLRNVHAEPNFITLSYISQNLAPQRPGTPLLCSPIVHMRGLRGPCAATSIQPACAVRGHLSAKLWKTLAFRLRCRQTTAILWLSAKQFCITMYNNGTLG